MYLKWKIVLKKYFRYLGWMFTVFFNILWTLSFFSFYPMVCVLETDCVDRPFL